MISMACFFLMGCPYCSKWIFISIRPKWYSVLSPWKNCIKVVNRSQIVYIIISESANLCLFNWFILVFPYMGLLEEYFVKIVLKNTLRNWQRTFINIEETLIFQIWTSSSKLYIDLEEWFKMNEKFIECCNLIIAYRSNFDLPH